MSTSLFSKFILPSGVALKNRVVKAAMEENMAEQGQKPGQRLKNLYASWCEGGVGLIITGNVMVDHLAMTGPGGLTLENDENIKEFSEIAQISQRNDCKIIMQINHPGRQVYKNMGGKALCPSAVPLDLGKHSKMFNQPKAMTIEEVEDVISRFVTTASLAKKAGYDGIQVHAAHGYLLAQFLSPITNKRSDQYGGVLENRARLLLDIVEKIKRSCGEGFIVSVKLNSADFQRGGFDVDDSLQVVSMLERLGIDFVELSGGSYEAPAMQGRTADDRTLQREAYFLEFAQDIAKQTNIPIMTTGGISKKVTAQTVLDSHVELVGIASALAYNPSLVNDWSNEDYNDIPLPKNEIKDKAISGLARMAMVKRQLRRVGRGQMPKYNDSPIFSLLLDQWRKARLTKRYRKTFNDEVV